MRRMMKKRTIGYALTAALMLATAVVGAQNPGVGRGAPGDCPGAGIGMMGPGMYGPGMGMGMGMPGGMGMGPGMMAPGMGAGPFATLNLSTEQRTKINAIQDSLRKQQWTLQGKINDEEARLRDLYLVDQPDPKRVGQAYGNIFDLRRQMIEAQVQAQNQMQSVLTAEQRNQIRQFHGGMRSPAPTQGQSPGGAAGASPPGGAADDGCLMY